MSRETSGKTSSGGYDVWYSPRPAGSHCMHMHRLYHRVSCDLALSVPREVHSVCSWDEKASVKIQKSLETEIHAFISEANKVRDKLTASMPSLPFTPKLLCVVVCMVIYLT